MTLPGAGAIARIGTDGSETDFPLPEEAPAGYPNDIVAGPDGALWFGKSRGAILGRIATNGEVTQLPLAKGSEIAALASGPFGDLWYGIGNGRIGWVIPGVAEGTTACINSCAAPVTDLAEGTRRQALVRRRRRRGRVSSAGRERSAPTRRRRWKFGSSATAVSRAEGCRYR